MTDPQPLSQERAPINIQGINRIGLLTLIKKEVGRFFAVYTQTIIAPVSSTLLFYAIFALAFGGIAREVAGVPYMEFIAPGLVMMAMVQNAFANTSSSIVISKVQGNIVDVLMPPLSPLELVSGYVIGGVTRGLVVGTVCLISVSFFVQIHIASVFYILAFALLGTTMLSALGLAGGLWSEKFDHIAAVTNFVVTPLAFLSGTFYSIESLPDVWQTIAHFDPFFYMIDGFRYGFIGQSDSDPLTGLIILSVSNIILLYICYKMLRTGYKIKS